MPKNRSPLTLLESHRFKSAGKPCSGLGITTGPDGALWFTEEFGNIGRMTTAGVVTAEFPSSSSPRGITTGPDRALWFAGSDFGIGHITTAGVITKFYGSSPYDITTGPDEALWFTEPAGSGIGRLAVTINTHASRHA